MRSFRYYRFLLAFMALLVFAGVMVVRQVRLNETRHEDLREALILLHTKGYATEAQHLYTLLLRELEKTPTRALLADYERTVRLVDLSQPQPDNLIRKYCVTVSNELDKRSQQTIARALKLANEE